MNTPRTDTLDAEERGDHLGYFAAICFARQLERELTIATEALKQCVTDHNAFCHTSESVEAAHRRLSEINRVALTALKELENR